AGFSAGQERYAVQVGTDGGWRLTPRNSSQQPGTVRAASVGEDAQAGAPMVVRTLSVSRGGVPLLGEARVSTREDGALAVERGPVVEVLRPLEVGVEQSWELAAKPEGEGDLEVKVELAGLAYEGTLEGGHHFRDEQAGLGVTYGNATWVDARGERTPVPSRYEDGTLVMRVPAEVVEGSEWPAVLDPLVSPDIPLPVTVPTGTQNNIAAATAGDIALVVWSETDAGGFTDIRGVRVRKSDGVQLDATPLCIACAPGVQDAAAVASNGSDFLVAWSDMPLSSSGSPLPPRIRSVRVRGSDGAVLGAPQLLSPENPPQFSPAVASDGNNYLVVWEGYQFQCVFLPGQRFPTCGYRHGIYGTRVSAASGAGGSNFLISPSNYPNVPPEATYGGGNYLVTWSGSPQEYSSTSNLYAARVRASDGVLLDPQARTVSTDGNNPVAASEGSRFLVVWNTLGGEIRGARLGADGAVLDAGGFHVGEGNTLTPANVLFDGLDYRVAWEQGAELERTLNGVRVTREGLVASGSEAVLAGVHYPSTWLWSGRPALAALSGQGRFLLGYAQYVAPPTQQARVNLRRVEDMPQGEPCTQDEACQSGYCVDGVCCESACGGGVGTDCQACSVAAGGVADGVCGIVRAEAAVVCRPSAVACDVPEVCDGTSAVCPADEPSASEPDLSGDKCEDTPCDVAHYVEGLGQEVLEQPFGHSLQVKADAACRAWREDDAEATRGSLRALLNEARAQQGKKLSDPVAATLIAALTGMLGLGA
ncbi:MAG: hypothetical protein ACXU86_09405, partial [Archangium sp.]